MRMTQGAHDAHGKRYASAVKQARKDVASHIVAAQQMRAGNLRAIEHQVHEIGVIGRNPAAYDDEQDEEDEKSRAKHGQPVLAKAPPRLFRRGMDL